MHKKYLFFDREGRGPLKSMLIRSIGWVAFTNCPNGGLKKFGLISAQVVQSLQVSFTSFSEYGKFFCFTKWKSRVTPGQPKPW